MKLFRKKRWVRAKDDPERPDRIMIEASAAIEVAAAAEGESPKRPTFVIDAYNGGILYVFGFWDGIVIDLTGLRAGRVPVLKDHDSGQVIGQGTAKIATRNVTVSGTVTGAYDREGTPAEEIVSQAKNGFIWAASIGVMLKRIESVEAGEKVKVNGQTFVGPVAIGRVSRLGEVSLLAVGADENANAQIAASKAKRQKGDRAMDFEKWLQGQSLVLAELSDGEIAELQVKFEAEQQGDSTAQLAKPPPVAQASGDNGTQPDPVKQYREAIAAEDERIAAIRKVCGGQHMEIWAKAIREGWDGPRAELEVLRADRPNPPNISASVPRDLGPMVIEAAMLMGAGHKVEKQYSEPVLDAAHKEYRHGLGVGELLCRMAEMATGRRFDLRHDGVRDIVRAAFSTADVANILSNVANKFLARGYEYGENADLLIASIKPVKDFKQKTSYRLNADGEFQQVPPGGTIAYGTLSDQTFTNKADTYGIVFGLDRRQIINDDLGAFDDLQMKIGQGAAMARQRIFWTEFLANLDDTPAAFFTAGNKNVATGAGSALGQAGLKAAITLLRKMKDPAGKMIAILPWKLLVPVALEGDADDLFKSEKIENTTASTVTHTTNRYRGRFEPIVSRYLDEVGFHANISATAWYLLADPAMVPVIELCFLNGVQTPTIEAVDPTVDYLGIQLRGYLDFGVNLQDPRGGIRSAGA